MLIDSSAIMSRALLGMRIIESEHHVDRKQIRTHRKKRINKKWAKRYGFSVTPKMDVYCMGNTLMMHPVVAQVLRKVAAKNY